ncbi:unnamed protein product [Euphydryas editha]|uniref:Hexosyltransferase n=1 Tax=Euphydryas editha TaxID=104508 RepID=A0AAU9UPD8_EUPED|nr:unnamed protein product [Euphydryas editha]
MFALLLRRYKGMILASILFFYLGCGITLSFIKIECNSSTSTTNNRKSNNDFKNNLDKVEYAVLIISSPMNEVKRDAIRATWANFVDNIIVENGEHLYKWNHTWIENNNKQDSIKCFFVVGVQGLDSVKLKKIQSEHARSNDLLLLSNFEDSYKNLASKLIHALQWISNNLKQLKYIIKCDDDSFVRIDLIVRDLEAFAPEMSGPTINQYVTYKKILSSYRGLYWGYFDGRARVYLNGKWQEKDWFLCDTYLPYALGGGYVISRSIVDYITKNSEFLSHYNSEDVSMGVWTAALDGINRVHDTRFDTEWKSRGCHNNMLVRHKQTPNDMFQMYRSLVHSKGSKLCKTETALRKYYHYNWDSLPSVCCK